MDKKQLLTRVNEFFQKVGHLDLISLINDLGIDVESGDLDDSFNAKINYDTNTGKYTIYINPDPPPTRVRFSLAHELAHYILHREDIKKQGALLRLNKQNITPEGVRKEFEADELAAQILMPDDIVLNFLANHGVEGYFIEPSLIRLMANHFKVSVPVASIRMRKMNYYVPWVE